MTVSGVQFNYKHCLDDYGLILAQKDIGLPEAQTNFVEVPGRDGYVDLSTALTNEMKYYSRIITLTFVTSRNISSKDWPNMLSDISNAIHGQKEVITFDDDIGYYYQGRCEVDSFATSNAKQTVVIKCTCDPYKYTLNAPGSPWMWDPFSFVDGVIFQTNFTVEGTLTTSLTNLHQSVVPTFTTTTEMQVVYEGATYQLNVGQTTIYDIVLREGENSITFIGNGTVSVSYLGGIL